MDLNCLTFCLPAVFKPKCGRHNLGLGVRSGQDIELTRGKQKMRFTKSLL